MRILLCDDDPMILVQMEKYLKEYFQKAHLRMPDIASYTRPADKLCFNYWHKGWKWPICHRSRPIWG